MTEETPPQVLLTATGFAAREALAVLRKHNIATAPLLLRAGLSEHGLARAADEGNGLPQRVSAIGQCRFLEYAAEAMDDSAFGLHLAGQIDPRDVGMYFYAGSAARDLGEALALFSRYCRIVNEAFRLTQRSADEAIDGVRVCGNCSKICSLRQKSAERTDPTSRAGPAGPFSSNVVRRRPRAQWCARESHP